MSSTNLEQARHNMIEQQIRPWDVLDPNVLAVLNRVHRDAFTPEAYASLAYADTEIPLGHDQYMMHPVLEGRMLQALNLNPGDRVLEIGTGSGYISACLSRLAGRVDSIEIDPELSEAANRRLQRQQIDNVNLMIGDAVNDFDSDQKYDAICVTGSLTQMVEPYKKALNPGGRLFVIIGEAPVMQAHLITRIDENAWADQILFETCVKPLIHAEKPKQFVF